MKSNNKYLVTLAYYLSYIAIGFVSGILGPALPSLSENTGTDYSVVSYLFPVLSIGYLLGSLFSGRQYDKHAGHPIIAVSLLILLCAVFFIPVTPYLILVLFLFFLVGLGSGGVDVGGNTLLIWTHGNRIGPFMVGLHFFYGFGAFIAPVLAGRIMEATGGIAWTFRILSIICIPVIIILIILRSPDRAVKNPEGSGSGSGGPVVVLLSVFMFLHVGVELSFGGWIYSYALESGNEVESGAALLTAVYWGSLTAARLLAVAIALKVRAEIIMTVDLIGCTIAGVVLLVFPASPAAVWTGTVMMGIFVASLVPLTFTYAGKNLKMSGSITRWFVIGIGSGNLVFPWLIGQLFGITGPPALPAVILFVLILAAIMLFAAFRKVKANSYG